MSFIYHVWYNSLNTEDDGDLTHETVLFNEIIAINPHNLHIVEVSVSYCEDEMMYSRAIYRRDEDDSNTIDSIQQINEVVSDIIEEWPCDKSAGDELLHLVDLWFTKFVPHK